MRFSSALVLALVSAAFYGQDVQSSASSSIQEVQSPSDRAEQPLADARLLLEDGKIDQAERMTRDYLREHSNSADGHFLLGYVLFRKVQQEQAAALSDADNANSTDAGKKAIAREESLKASLAEFTEGARYHPPAAFDLKVVALDYVLLNDYADADKWLSRSLKENAEDSETWYYLGRTKYNENRFEEAISAFQQYLKLDPKSVKGEDNLGLAFQGLGRTEDASAAYRTAISWQKQKLDQDSGPFINLGSLLLDQNQLQQALPYLQQAISIAPREPRAHEQLGKAYERLSEFTKAQGEFERAVQLAPENFRLHYMLGRIYQKEGQTDRAKLEFDRSAALRAKHRPTEAER